MTTRKWRPVWIIILLLAIVLVPAYMWQFPSGTLRYRMTVQVDVDGQIYESSAVHQVMYSYNLPFHLGNPISDTFKGEALVLDIGNRGALFVLLTGPRCCPEQPFSRQLHYQVDAEQLVAQQFDLRVHQRENVRSLSSRQQRAEVQFDQLPMLVTFRDEADPTSITIIDPYDLVETFGPGVTLLGVTLESTADPVTWGIERRLPWLSDLRGAIHKHLSVSDPLSSVNNGSFIMGRLL